MSHHDQYSALAIQALCALVCLGAFVVCWRYTGKQTRRTSGPRKIRSAGITIPRSRPCDLIYDPQYDRKQRPILALEFCGCSRMMLEDLRFEPLRVCWVDGHGLLMCSEALTLSSQGRLHSNVIHELSGCGGTDQWTQLYEGLLARYSQQLSPAVIAALHNNLGCCYVCRSVYQDDVGCLGIARRHFELAVTAAEEAEKEVQFGYVLRRNYEAANIRLEALHGITLLQRAMESFECGRRQECRQQLNEALEELEKKLAFSPWKGPVAAVIADICDYMADEEESVVYIGKMLERASILAADSYAPQHWLRLHIAEQISRLTAGQDD